MKKLKWLLVIISTFAFATSTAQVRGTSDPTSSTTPTTTTSSSDVTSSTFAPVVSADTSGIQSAGKSSSGNNNMGMLLGIGATAYTGYNAVQSCTAKSPSCPYWIAGVVASVAVTGYMMSAKSKSDGTVAAVTDPSTGTTGSGSGSSSNSSGVDYSQDPAWQGAQNSIAQLKSSGWNINPTTGTATNTQTGQTIKASDLSSPAAMSAAGFSASDIKGFQNVMDQAQAAGKKLAASRGADASGSLFDGVAGGGKSAGANVKNAMGDGMALRPGASQVGGINRDPAQVAGMAKSYNGDQIGVAQDSLFNMIDRRYQLHEQNGSFLSNP